VEEKKRKGMKGAEYGKGAKGRGKQVEENYA
jgi:hypothetical protein